MQAAFPESIESCPKLGPTVLSSKIVIGAGSAPALSKIARSFADWALKRP